ncbi:MAG TPA: UDP-N-acetylmuramoyl-L-alanyl-D-glutamate--2,6-diaminopimelate ligase, partial [Coxiellaceae bacterium]|nr:UDP-N-acetylmuramoyl-L-alanyl-D-glutamate--2,6-diaminopimelate ligase [Coxiellaceae bacterium]
MDSTQPFDFTKFSSLTNDSRAVVPGSLFLAYPGDAVDGRNYITQAIEKGAAQIIYDPAGDFQLPTISIPAAPIENLRVKQSSIAAEFYHFPARQLSIIGVTGTNGKTSVTQFIAQALSMKKTEPHAAMKETEPQAATKETEPQAQATTKKTEPQAQACGCAVIGTMGYGFLPHLKTLKNTTPDGMQLQKIFSDLKKQGANTIAMEVSSHALAQQRVNDTNVETIVFTNLTQDHLDYHGTMEKYRDAKELLFQASGVKNAVINVDDDAGVYFSKKYRSQLNVMTYAIHNHQADIFVIKKTVRDLGFELTVKTPWGKGTLVLPLLGEFNIANSLAVLGVLGLKGMPFEKILAHLSQLKSVAGRMEVLSLRGMPSVVIDYAHTPDALEKILTHTRARVDGKVWCVFGCGGNRDKTKRPIMGAIADKYSDCVIITNDNPRHESADMIAAEILSGVTEKNKCKIILDRNQAIMEAIIHASKNDWIVIAGKGHETEQMMGDQSIAHNDKHCAFSAYRARTKKMSVLAEIIGGQLVDDDAVYENISIDSRVIKKSDCFIAIQGEHFDGHDFVALAVEKGAAAVVVSKKINAAIPQIIVKNTREALLTIASFYRETTTIPVAAITGSCGKTTTRALLENILKQRHSVLASQKSFNNDIGIPLTLLQLNETHDVAVIEMGANHAGELAILTRVVKPTVAAITLAAPAHLAGFGSIDGVARAKAEIFDGLTADGIAVINADDAYADFWKNKNSGRRIITFGCEHLANVMARDMTSTQFTLQLP